MKKIILLIVFSFLLFGCEKSEEVFEEEEKNAIVNVLYNDNLEVSFLDKVKVSDFIKEINGTINDYEIDTTEIGIRKIDYDYINEQGIKVKQSFNINIIDKKAPIIWLSGTYTLTKGENIDVAKKIMCADDYDDNPNCYIEGDYDSNKVCSYNLKYIAKDSSGNESSKNFTLKVVNPSNNNSNSGNQSRTDFNEVIKKYKNDNTQVGLDISKWQGDIDFDKLKAAGVEFVFIRVGVAAGQGKENNVDVKYEYNIKEANRVGIPVGIYFYSYADSKNRAIEDAKWVIEHIKDYKVDLPVAYDWERWGAYNEYHQSIYHLTENAKAYLDTLKNAGYDGLLYSSKTYLENIWYDTGYDVWLAHYTKQTSYKGPYTYWQMCSDGKVDGIDGAVDINIRYLNK